MAASRHAPKSCRRAGREGPRGDGLLPSGNAEGNPSSYQGVRLVYRPFIDSKSLGTLSHTANCLLHAVGQDFDVLMVFNAGNAPLCIIPRLFGRKIAINVDGLEWKRAKWGRAPSSIIIR